MPVTSKLGIAVFCTVTFCAYAYAQSYTGNATGIDHSDQPYRAAPIYIVGERDVQASVEVGGTVVPFKQVTLTAQVPGRVEFVAGREGDGFSAGTVLAAINSDQLRARLEQASTTARNAMLAMRDAELKFERERQAPRSRDINAMPGMGMPALFDQIFTRNFGSALGYGDPWLERYSDLSTFGTQMEQARGQYQAAMWQLRELEARLRTTTGQAPFNGVVLKKMVEVGDAVQPGQPLVKFADLSRLQLTVDVPARLVTNLRPGQILSARLDFNNEFVDVRLAQIFPMGNAQRHTITLKFDLPPGYPGVPGTYAEVHLPDSEDSDEPVLEIPTSSVVQRGSLPAVFVVDGARQELRMVRLGQSNARDTITVLSGLSVGDQVLIHPPPGIRSRTLIEAKAM